MLHTYEVGLVIGTLIGVVIGWGLSAIIFQYRIGKFEEE